MQLDCQQAVKDAMQVCEDRMAKETYPMLSARDALRIAGYDNEEIAIVLAYIASRGFDYCLDHSIECSSGVGVDSPQREKPSQDVCVWGCDQLLSRLHFIA